MKFFLGIDGGQSSTTALLGDETGRLIGKGVAGPCNHASAAEGREKFVRALTGCVSAALAEAGLDASTRFDATCMFYTGIDPFTKQAVYVAKNLRDRKLQRALLQFFKPENYFEVRKALEQAGRADLIGGGCDALIPANPPNEALAARHTTSAKAAASLMTDD